MLFELIKHLKKEIDNVLEDEVLKAVQDVEVEAIEDVVYSVYNPKVYVRRREAGGLQSKHNIVGNVKSGTLVVTNIARPNLIYDTSMPADANLAEVIEYGSGYNGNVYDYRVPRQVYGRRPFTRAATYRLFRDKKHVTALRKGLIDRGFDVR